MFLPRSLLLACLTLGLSASLVGCGSSAAEQDSPAPTGQNSDTPIPEPDDLPSDP